MNTVNYITPSDGDIYLVNNQTYVNSGGTDFDKIYNNISYYICYFRDNIMFLYRSNTNNE